MITNEQKMNPFYPTPVALGEDNMTIEEALKLLSEYYFVSGNIEKEYKEAIKFAINKLRNDIELKKAILKSSLHNRSEKKCNCIENATISTNDYPLRNERNDPKGELKMITALEAKKNADDVNFSDGTYEKILEEINDMISGLSKNGVYTANFLLDERTIGYRLALTKILEDNGYEVIIQNDNDKNSYLRPGTVNLLVKWS